MNIWEIDKLLFFITFVIPGFIAIKFYSLLHPNDRLDSSKQIIDSLAYSCICYALVGFPIVEFSTNIKKLPFFCIWFLVVIILLVLPCLLAFGFSKIRQCVFFQKNAPHPTHKPWDFIFQQGEWYWLIIELNDGKRIGGKFADNSFASSYPAAEQIYLEEYWHIDACDSFIRARNGTSGILIGSSNIKTVEFFKYDNGEQTNDSKQKNTFE